MKYTIATLLLILISLTAFGKDKTDSLLILLDQAISNSGLYEKRKEERINHIKKDLLRKDISDNDRYRIHGHLYHEYESYISDSARHHINRTIEIAIKEGNQTWINNAKIKKAELLATSGLYAEAIKLLQSIEVSSLSEEKRAEYYIAFEHTYLYQAEYVSGDELMWEYLEEMNNYRDSALMVLPEHSYQSCITRAARLVDQNRQDEAAALMLGLLPQIESGTRDYSILTSILAYIYASIGNMELQKEYLIRSAISDIHAVVKENNSIRALAEILYEEGQIARADHYMKMSMEDANFYNARLRNIQASKMLPIIDSAYQLEKEKQRKKLQASLAVISFLSLLLVIAVVYVVLQMRKLTKARKEVMTVNTELQKLNMELTHANTQQRTTNNSLAESNRIKEEYIGRFLNLCSTYIDKMESYRRMLNKKAASGKVDDLYKTLKSTQFIEIELKEFYQNFDSSFLNIFPHFVENLNSLLPEEEQIILKQEGCLNTELRIFALIRLGITDSLKIANFLRYSITTIYTYRSKLKNKSLHKDCFEEKVMEIGRY